MALLILDHAFMFKFLIKIDTQPIYIPNALGHTPLHYIVSNHDLIKYVIINYSINDHLIDSDITLLECLFGFRKALTRHCDDTQQQTGCKLGSN